MNTLEKMLQEAQEVSFKMDLVVLGVKSIVELTEAMEKLADSSQTEGFETMLEGALLVTMLEDVMEKVNGLLEELEDDLDDELKAMLKAQTLEVIQGKEQYLVVALMLTGAFGGAF